MKIRPKISPQILTNSPVPTQSGYLSTTNHNRSSKQMLRNINDELYPQSTRNDQSAATRYIQSATNQHVKPNRREDKENIPLSKPTQQQQQQQQQQYSSIQLNTINSIMKTMPSNAQKILADIMVKNKINNCQENHATAEISFAQKSTPTHSSQSTYLQVLQSKQSQAKRSTSSQKQFQIIPLLSNSSGDDFSFDVSRSAQQRQQYSETAQLSSQHLPSTSISNHAFSQQHSSIYSHQQQISYDDSEGDFECEEDNNVYEDSYSFSQNKTPKSFKENAKAASISISKGLPPSPMALHSKQSTKQSNTLLQFNDEDDTRDEHIQQHSEIIDKSKQITSTIQMRLKQMNACSTGGAAAAAVNQSGKANYPVKLDLEKKKTESEFIMKLLDNLTPQSSISSCSSVQQQQQQMARQEIIKQNSIIDDRKSKNMPQCIVGIQSTKPQQIKALSPVPTEQPSQVYLEQTFQSIDNDEQSHFLGLNSELTNESIQQQHSQSSNRSCGIRRATNHNSIGSAGKPVIAGACQQLSLQELQLLESLSRKKLVELSKVVNTQTDSECRVSLEKYVSQAKAYSPHAALVSSSFFSSNNNDKKQVESANKLSNNAGTSGGAPQRTISTIPSNVVIYKPQTPIESSIRSQNKKPLFTSQSKTKKRPQAFLVDDTLNIVNTEQTKAQSSERSNVLVSSTCRSSSSNHSVSINSQISGIGCESSTTNRGKQTPLGKTYSQIFAEKEGHQQSQQQSQLSQRRNCRSNTTMGTSHRREIENLHLTVSEKEAEIFQLRLKLQDLQEVVDTHSSLLQRQNFRHGMSNIVAGTAAAAAVAIGTPTANSHNHNTHKQADLLLQHSAHHSNNGVQCWRPRSRELEERIISRRINHNNSSSYETTGGGSCKNRSHSSLQVRQSCYQSEQSEQKFAEPVNQQLQLQYQTNHDSSSHFEELYKNKHSRRQNVLQASSNSEQSDSPYQSEQLSDLSEEQSEIDISSQIRSLAAQGQKVV